MPHAPTGPASLLASLPAHLGRTLHPPEAVVLGWSDDAPDEVAVAALDLDGADPDDEVELARAVVIDGAERVVIVVAFPRPWRDGPQAFPTAESIARFVAASSSRFGLDVLDAVVIHGDRWRSLSCTDPACCPPEGTPVPTPTEETP